MRGALWILRRRHVDSPIAESGRPLVFEILDRARQPHSGGAGNERGQGWRIGRNGVPHAGEFSAVVRPPQARGVIAVSTVRSRRSDDKEVALSHMCAESGSSELIASHRGPSQRCTLGAILLPCSSLGEWLRAYVY
jgi:hypothetical protein